LEAIEQRPGATVPELAQLTGIDKNVVYSAMARLAGSGQAHKETLPGGKIGYRSVGFEAETAPA
jgi:hypothetical protein